MLAGFSEGISKCNKVWMMKILSSYMLIKSCRKYGTGLTKYGIWNKIWKNSWILLIFDVYQLAFMTAPVFVHFRRDDTSYHDWRSAALTQSCIWKTGNSTREVHQKIELCMELRNDTMTWLPKGSNSFKQVIWWLLTIPWCNCGLPSPMYRPRRRKCRQLRTTIKVVMRKLNPDYNSAWTTYYDQLNMSKVSVC